jgi:16S rRNA processing protein RimM
MTESAGNPSSQPVRYLDIGVIIGPFGLDGHVRVYIFTDFPERFLETDEIRVGERLRRYPVEEARLVRNEAILKLEGVDDAETAGNLKGEALRVPIAEAVALEEGQFYWHQVEGLEVVTEEGESLGRVGDILRTGANDVYVVTGPRGEVLVPAIASVVIKIDIKSGRIVIRPMPGMLGD